MNSVTFIAMHVLYRNKRENDGDATSLYVHILVDYDKGALWNKCIL